MMELAQARADKEKKNYLEFNLDSFCFYVDSAIYPYEMRPLHHLATKMGHDRFFFDGVLSDGGVRHYVQKVEVSALPIGNYGIDHPSVQGEICMSNSPCLLPLSATSRVSRAMYSRDSTPEYRKTTEIADIVG
jgi:hypothetical protein